MFVLLCSFFYRVKTGLLSTYKRVVLRKTNKKTKMNKNTKKTEKQKSENKTNKQTNKQTKTKSKKQKRQKAKQKVFIIIKQSNIINFFLNWRTLGSNIAIKGLID